MYTRPKSSRVKFSKHRERRHTEGPRAPQTSLPDIHVSAFKAEAQQQSLAAAQSAQSVEDQAFIDAISVQPE